MQFVEGPSALSVFLMFFRETEMNNRNVTAFTPNAVEQWDESHNTHKSSCDICRLALIVFLIASMPAMAAAINTFG